MAKRTAKPKAQPTPKVAEPPKVETIDYFEVRHWMAQHAIGRAGPMPPYLKHWIEASEANKAFFEDTLFGLRNGRPSSNEAVARIVMGIKIAYQIWNFGCVLHAGSNTSEEPMKLSAKWWGDAD